MTTEPEHWYEYWGELRFWDGIFQPIDDTMGIVVFALFVGSFLSLSLYSWTETIMTPAIILALFGGLLIGYAPPQAAIVGTLMVVVALSIALLSIWGED